MAEPVSLAPGAGRRRLIAVALAASLASCNQSAPARGARLALVVGNARYRSLPVLRNTARDATLVAGAAAAAGFKLFRDMALWDLGRAAMTDAVRRVADEARGGGALLLYYAGHGVQLHHENWIAPVDAVGARQADVGFSMIAVSSLLDTIAASDVRSAVVLLDACRANPFLAPGIAGLEQGMAQVRPPPRVAVGFSTQPGTVATDGFGPDGPYALAIARALGGEPVIADMLTGVSDAVWRVTGGQQRPWSVLGADVGSLNFASS